MTSGSSVSTGITTVSAVEAVARRAGGSREKDDKRDEYRHIHGNGGSNQQFVTNETAAQSGCFRRKFLVMVVPQDLA
ncbi:MAG: hypothetical protein ACLUOF_03150 [Ruminococcus sp.]